jgi:signal transduction histidine kinase/PAS domain-containing protein
MSKFSAILNPLVADSDNFKNTFIDNEAYYCKLIWNVTVISFLVIFGVHFAFIQEVNIYIILAALAVVALFLFIRALINKNKLAWVKFLLILVIYGGLFFFDLVLGNQIGVYFYYFSFVTAVATIFKWHIHKKWIITVAVLPLLLNIVSYFIRTNFDAAIFPINPKWVQASFLFNCVFSFIIVVVQILYFSYTISLREDRSVQVELNLQTLLNTASANIRTINTNYEITSFNKGFLESVRKFYDIEVTKGFNIKEKLFPHVNYSEDLKAMYTQVLNGERVNLEYKSNNAYFEIIAAPLLDKENKVIGAILYDRDISEKKKKENDLQQLSLNLQTLIDNTQGAIWSIDKWYKVIAVNASFQRNIKVFFNVDIRIGDDILDLKENEGYPARFKEYHVRVMSGQKIFEQYQVADNFFEIKAEPLRDTNGEIIGATFHNLNITQRQQNQMQLEQFSSNLQSLIDNTNDSFWSVDIDYTIITASKVYKEDMIRIFNTEVYIGYDVKQFFNHPKYPASWKQQYLDVFSGKEIQVNYEFENSHYELNARPIFNNNDKIIGAAFYTSNVTQKYISEQKLKQSEINLQSLIDTNVGSIWGIDTKYKLLACNTKYKLSAKKRYGLDLTTGFDLGLLFEYPEYPQIVKTYYKAVLRGETIHEVLEDELAIFEITGVPILNNGEVVGAALFSEDVTEKRKSEREIIQAIEKAEEASKAKARFLSNMSHELRTPLNGVIGMTNIIFNEPILDHQKEHLEILKYSSDHMLSLVNDILDFSKIEEGKIELEKSPFNLNATIDKTAIIFSAQAKEKELQFITDTVGIENIELQGDITRLRQVLNNLLTNAIKFTEKGTVGLNVSKVKEINEKQCLIKFEVVDTGIGINKNNISKIFESFTQADADTTRKYGGTGLGLTISRRLIELMGGKLDVKSKEKKGSSFSFNLVFDYYNNETNDEVTATEETMYLFDNLKVLVAEDNKINMLVARKNLQKWNIEVQEAENGKIACEKFAQHKFDLILMDMEMPIMDGLTAVEFIRKTDTEIPIIALTAASFENMHQYLRGKGLNDYVQKPFMPKELNQKINRLINFS